MSGKNRSVNATPVSERFMFLDTLRGFAVLGILVVIPSSLWTGRVFKTFVDRLERIGIF